MKIEIMNERAIFSENLVKKDLCGVSSLTGIILKAFNPKNLYLNQ